MKAGKDAIHRLSFQKFIMARFMMPVLRFWDGIEGGDTGRKLASDISGSV